ncbi:MAG: nicotinate-nucleotide--dimethylbenzimidazole phosphoribosyltransferase [Anaerolineales bacterium]|nr:MAG: nicotinate-nucleotide--dimethylbenzimidazole phosphoribosyltransferase [Anaerolineales bacterium]
MEQRLHEVIGRIQPLDSLAQSQARARQAALTKPAGSLGRLEALSIQIAGITGQALPEIEHKVVVTMAADHGVAAEGVSAFPQEVTRQMVSNFLRGGAAINGLGRHTGTRIVVGDLGAAADIAPHPNLLDRKVAPGTGNIARGPAMSRDQAIQALLSGVAVVEEELTKGLDIVGTGDMGIANTTPSAAIAVALMGIAAAEMVGRGTGLDDAGLLRKVKVVETAIAVNRPDAGDPLDVLAKVGGFEIGGLAGVMLGAAAHRRPVVVDGFISTAAAMIAVGLAPRLRQYLIAAHCSQEKGHRIMLDWLGLEPLLDLGMRLGEGTGAVLGIFLVEAACKILAQMATFGQAGVSDRESA